MLNKFKIFYSRKFPKEDNSAYTDKEILIHFIICCLLVIIFFFFLIYFLGYFFKFANIFSDAAASQQED